LKRTIAINNKNAPARKRKSRLIIAKNGSSK
jgi:hypothetical protein